jgi:hypothetical protein
VSGLCLLLKIRVSLVRFRPWPPFFPDLFGHLALLRRHTMLSRKGPERVTHVTGMTCYPLVDSSLPSSRRLPTMDRVRANLDTVKLRNHGSRKRLTFQLQQWAGAAMAVK